MNESTSAISSTTADQQLAHEKISRRAQELWEKYGRPSGRDEEIWLEAERNLQANAAKSRDGQSSPASFRPSRGSSSATATPRMPQSRASGRSSSRQS